MNADCLSNLILFDMDETLSSKSAEKLRRVLDVRLHGLKFEAEEHGLITESQTGNTAKAIKMFFVAKKIEGLTDKSLAYYRTIMRMFFTACQKPVELITTDDVRYYLAEKQIKRAISKATMDNERRVLSSFFQFCEDEGYIAKNPVRRIKKVKQEIRIKEPFSDEELERLRDSCESARDLAIVDLLSSTGMRIGELEPLNRSDVNFESMEIKVFGKGEKERIVYLNARAKIHLTEYLKSRADNEKALFIGMHGGRLLRGGIETMLRTLGKKAGVENVYPHRFRRTAATQAINRGMPIEQVQQMLGHAKIETTTRYAIVSQRNVKASHEKYLN